jgi:hypothetical protein
MRSSTHAMLQASSETTDEATGNVCMNAPRLALNFLPVSLRLVSVPMAIAVALLLTSCASAPPKPAPPPAAPPPPSPPAASQTPGEFCAATQGGTYLGDMRCQLKDGTVVKLLSGSDAIRANATSIPVQTPDRAWALATTALIFEFNRNHLDTLTGVPATPDSMENERKQLMQGWNIGSQADLLKTLHWLQFQGHRAEFIQLGLRVAPLTDTQFADVRAQLSGNLEALNQLDIVRQHYQALGVKSILAWDLIRYIALCRWGALTGYITDTEAWSFIMPAALNLQRTFDSWDDLQTNYLIGREFWSLQQTQRSGARFQAMYKKLSEDPNSPWRTIAWKTPLRAMEMPTAGF